MNVRCALMDDLEEIIELYDAVSDAMKESAFDIGWRKNLYPSKEMIQSDIKQQTLYILQKEEKIIGAMVLNHESDPCYQNVYWQINVDDTEAIILHRFCIHPDFHGCGKYFLKQALKIAQKQNQRVMRLDVLSSNLPAIRLYEKCSFLLQGKQMMDYGKTVIAHLYEKLI